MRKVFILLIPFLFIALGCQRENIFQANDNSEISEIQAYDGDAQSKTVLAEDETSILWSPNDEISVFFNSTGIKFTALNNAPASWTVFQSDKALVYGGTEESNKPYIYGIYPYSDTNLQIKDTLVLSVPYNQVAVEGSFGKGCYPSVGRSKDTSIPFYNVCGGLRFTVASEGINKIVFKGNNDEYLAGKVKVVFDEEGHPTVSKILEGEKSITLCTPSDSCSFEVGKWYYISMLPGVLSNGCSIKIYQGSKQAELKIDSSREIKRSKFGQLAEIDKGLVFKTGISQIVLDKTELNLMPMTAAQLSYTIYPENAEYEWIKWESSDRSIAKVDEDGIVTMANRGTCTITVSSDNGTTASCVVTSEFGIEITPTELYFAAEPEASQTVSITSSYDWKISNAPDWASFYVNGQDATKESISASASPVTMIVTAVKNTGSQRNKDVKFRSLDGSYLVGLSLYQEPTDPSKAEAKTVQEFITLADTDNYYKLTGTVSGFSADYCSFDLTDATGSIYVYSVEQASKAKYASIIKDGGTITLSGKYDYYAAKCQHEVTSAVILDYKDPEHKTITTEKVSDVIAAAVGDTIVLNNAIVVAAAKTGYIVSDAQNSGNILVFQKTEGADTQTAVGDRVNVKAIRAAYSGMPQLNDPTTTVVSSGSQVTWPTPDDITSTFDSFTSTSVKYISYKGSLSVNGNYYNITVDGATKRGSILPSTAAEAYIGLPNTTFKGYYIYTSSSKYIYMVFTEAQTSSEPYLTVSPESINVDATAGTTTITINSNAAWTAESNNPDFSLSASSGSGNGTITVTYPQNVTESAKNATVTITAGLLSKEVAITQAKSGTAKYTWELKAGELTAAGGTFTSGGATWTYPEAVYIGFDSSNGRGVQIGKTASAQTSYTLSTDYFASPKVISSITVNASMAGSGDAKLSIAVGGVEVLSNQELTTTATDYTVNNINKSGTVEIKYTATKKAYYLKSVTIEY